MSYLIPSEFVTKMIDAGKSKIFMSTRDTVVRAYMAGAILALAAWMAVTINVQTGQPIVGAVLFPVGFCMLYLLGFDLLTGVFVLTPLALLDKRPGVTFGGVMRNWGLVFIGNFAGALTDSLHHGLRDDVRLHAGAGQGRHRHRQYRRGAHARLRLARRARHGDAVHARHAVQLDGLDRRRRRDDIDDCAAAR